VNREALRERMEKDRMGALIRVYERKAQGLQQCTMVILSLIKQTSPQSMPTNTQIEMHLIPAQYRLATYPSRTSSLKPKNAESK
jgi:hypothetical protein